MRQELATSSCKTSESKGERPPPGESCHRGRRCRHENPRTSSRKRATHFYPLRSHLGIRKFSTMLISLSDFINSLCVETSNKKSFYVVSFALDDESRCSRGCGVKAATTRICLFTIKGLSDPVWLISLLYSAPSCTMAKRHTAESSPNRQPTAVLGVPLRNVNPILVKTSPPGICSAWYQTLDHRCPFRTALHQHSCACLSCGKRLRLVDLVRDLRPRLPYLSIE